MALSTTYFDPVSPLSHKFPNFALQIIIFCLKHTVPVIIDAHRTKHFYTTWLRGVACQETTFWPKLMGPGLGEHVKNIGTSYLFLQPLKLATSNLVYNLGLGSSLPRNKFYNQNWQGVWARGVWKEIWDPLFISATVEASNFKFGIQVGLGSSLPRNKFYNQNWQGVWARGVCKEIWDPLFISATVEASNFKFGIQVGLGE